MNEWLELFGLESVWDDIQPSLADIYENELLEEQEKELQKTRRKRLENTDVE